MIRKKKFANVFRWRGWLSKAICAAGVVTLMTIAGTATRSDATTLCVNKKGSGGCYSTIQAAIDAVQSTDAPATIVVAPGKYTATCGGPACSVASISSSNPNGDFLVGLTLKCREVNGRSVVLDATGLDHAVYISDENGVKVQGCVAENAGREGILVEDSSNVTIRKNEVMDNDKSLSQSPPCPTFVPPNGSTIPYCCQSAGSTNFPEDNDDCGEGIHLRSVTASVVEGNSVHNNVGGILLTDETGPNEGNLIAGNVSRHNTLDCGITLASHTECTSGSTDVTGCTPLANAGYGVVYNSVVGNKSIGNGAAGVGAFANPGSPTDGGAATDASSNLISDNVLKNNGQPGVAIHVHAENGRANHNVVIENVISGNGGDGEAVPGSPPPGMGIEVLSNGSFGNSFGAASPILGTTISQNKVSGEPIDVWVGNTETSATVFLNDLNGAGKTGVRNDGTGTVVATDNWWNCPKGPGGGPSCSVVGGTGSAHVLSTPYLHHSISPED